MKYHVLFMVATAMLLLGACEKTEKDDPSEEKIQKNIYKAVNIADNQGTPYTVPAYDTAAARRGLVWRAEGSYHTHYPVSVREYDSAEYHITETTRGVLPWCVTLTFSDSTHCREQLVKNQHRDAGYFGFFDKDGTEYSFLFHRDAPLPNHSDTYTFNYIEILSPADEEGRCLIMEDISDTMVHIFPSTGGADDEGVWALQFIRLDPDSYCSPYE
ncbi:MAG: hypothetical protein J5677_03870 [Bacteroidales bacterium]|nr:hypothetical protein [Bacteroidales bacterium]